MYKVQEINMFVLENGDVKSARNQYVLIRKW